MSTNCVKLTFFDDYWVDARPGTRRRWFAPELHSISATARPHILQPQRSFSDPQGL